MKTFGLIAGLLFFLTLGIGSTSDNREIQYLLEKGRLLRVPVASVKATRKSRQVGFWLDATMHYMPVSKAQFDTIEVGTYMQVVHGPGTYYLMWPEDVNVREVRRNQQQALVSFLLVGICGAGLLWRIKPKSVAHE